MASSPPRIRKDVYKLGAGDKTLEWYGRAITEMQKRPINHPTSWRYQAAIHGYDRNMDPFAKASDVPPSKAERAKYWSQCQHQSWYFLPWHRGYLIYFERICLAEIVKLGGPKDWALPYWNYSDRKNPNAMKVPPAFLNPTVGGKPNPLFSPGRKRGTPGNAPIHPTEVDLACLKRTRYIGASDGGSPGFGGPETGLNNTGGPAPGHCELTPHNSIHGAVSGRMGFFETAGLEPLFWLHHCNIDRLWEVWRGRKTSTGDPTSTAWLDRVFDIHDEKGAAVTFRSRQMSSTVKNGYKYQDVSDPFAAAGGSILAGVEEEAPVADTGSRQPAELAGATDTAVPLGEGKSTARVAVAAPSDDILASVDDGEAPPQRVFLNLENITGTGEPGSYLVYMNVPEGEDPEDYPDRLVGNLPLFGISEASRADSKHGGSGLTIVLEITDVVRHLQDEGIWNEGDLDVDFVPLTPSPDDAGVKIGRISVYRA